VGVGFVCVCCGGCWGGNFGGGGCGFFFVVLYMGVWLENPWGCQAGGGGGSSLAFLGFGGVGCLGGGGGVGFGWGGGLGFVWGFGFLVWGGGRGAKKEGGRRPARALT